MPKGDEIRKAKDLFNRMGLPLTDYSGMEKSLNEIAENKAKEDEKKDRREAKRFWLSFGVAIAALAVAIFSLGLQCMPNRQIQQSIPKEVLSPPIELLDSTKKDSPKNRDTTSLKTSPVIPTTGNPNTPKSKNSH